jgi:hypothetical protein
VTNDWDTYQRIDRTDHELNALQIVLYGDLTPQGYGDGTCAAIQQQKIRKHLEERNHTARVRRAALAVAGFETRGWQEAAA